MSRIIEFYSSKDAIKLKFSMFQCYIFTCYKNVLWTHINQKILLHFIDSLFVFYFTVC